LDYRDVLALQAYAAEHFWNTCSHQEAYFLVRQPLATNIEVVPTNNTMEANAAFTKKEKEKHAAACSVLDIDL